MGRPSLFDDQEALTAVMLVFWRNGYTGTTMAELRQATGLKTGSIYNRFGSKKALFLQALDHYISEVIDSRICQELNRGEPLEGIEAFFSSAYESVAVQDLIGCLLTNTSMDREVDDEQISSITCKGLERIEHAIKDRLIQAKAAGDINSQIDPSAMALHLLSSFQGLCVLSRVTKDKKRLRIVTEQTLKAIR